VIPHDVQALADQRARARADKDWAASDALRDRIADLGWAVKDTADGHVLAALPPYPVLQSVQDLPDRSTEPDSHPCTVALLVDGWPDDLRTCVAALLRHAPDDVRLVLLDNGGTDAAATVHELARAHGRVAELHVERPAGWAEARNALVRWDTAGVHVLMDLSTVLEGDALTPLLEALAGGPFAAAGWRGVHVQDGWASFADSPPGEVEALLSYLIAVRRSAALQVPLPARARFYRNADMEWSFLLREAGLRLLALDLPVRQDRHRGYHDSDPELRDRESRRTYDRFLQRFRGREDLRLPH
jgi:hypothetical protein